MKGEYPHPKMSCCPRMWQNPFYLRYWRDFWLYQDLWKLFKSSCGVQGSLGEKGEDSSTSHRLLRTCCRQYDKNEEGSIYAKKKEKGEK
jgi:hypothetical protein